MKKVFIAVFILFSCNSSEDSETIKIDITSKARLFIAERTGGGMMMKECKLYQLDHITAKDAMDFRIRALSDSLIIHKRLDEFYSRSIQKRKNDMQGLDSTHQSTAEVKKVINRFVSLTDSNNIAAVKTKITLDSLISIKAANTNQNNYYKAMFSICHFNITTSSACDSFAFLFDKQRNIISIHLKDKL